MRSEAGKEEKQRRDEKERPRLEIRGDTVDAHTKAHSQRLRHIGRHGQRSTARSVRRRAWRRRARPSELFVAASRAACGVSGRISSCPRWRRQTAQGSTCATYKRLKPERPTRPCRRSPNSPTRSGWTPRISSDPSRSGAAKHLASPRDQSGDGPRASPLIRRCQGDARRQEATMTRVGASARSRFCLRLRTARGLA